MNAMMKLKVEIEKALGLPADSMEIRDHEGRAMVCYRPTPTLPSLIEIEIYRSVLDEGAWQVAAIRDSISNHFWEDLKVLRVKEEESPCLNCPDRTRCWACPHAISGLQNAQKIEEIKEEG